MSSNYISRKITDLPVLASTLNNISNLYSNSLWHQLTIALRSLEVVEEFQTSSLFLEFYQNFISSFKSNLNPLELSQMIVFASSQQPDANSAISFIKEEMKEIGNPTEDAALLLQGQIGLLYLSLSDPKLAKSTFADIESKLISSHSPIVHCKTYELSMELNKHSNQPSLFFKSAMQYLGYADLSKIPHKVKTALACEIGVASLIGKDIFNFGELLQQPILSSLPLSDMPWLLDMLTAFNFGNISQFEKLIKDAEISSQAISSNSLFLSQKIRLSALLEMVFNRKAGNRSLSFNEISQSCQVPLEEVEVLLIGAFSQDLIRGEIDQVSRVVHVSWILPRVLEKSQLVHLRNRVSNWGSCVNNAVGFLENTEPDLLAKEFLL